MPKQEIQNNFFRAILDPRYKDRYFDADLKQVEKNKLEKEVDKMTASATTSASATDGPTPDAEDIEPEEGEPQEKRMLLFVKHNIHLLPKPGKGKG